MPRQALSSVTVSAIPDRRSYCVNAKKCCGMLCAVPCRMPSCTPCRVPFPMEFAAFLALCLAACLPVCLALCLALLCALLLAVHLALCLVLCLTVLLSPSLFGSMHTLPCASLSCSWYPMRQPHDTVLHQYTKTSLCRASCAPAPRQERLFSVVCCPPAATKPVLGLPAYGAHPATQFTLACWASSPFCCHFAACLPICIPQPWPCLSFWPALADLLTAREDLVAACAVPHTRTPSVLTHACEHMPPMLPPAGHVVYVVAHCMCTIAHCMCTIAHCLCTIAHCLCTIAHCCLCTVARCMCTVAHCMCTIAHPARPADYLPLLCVLADLPAGHEAHRHECIRVPRRVREPHARGHAGPQDGHSPHAQGVCALRQLDGWGVGGRGCS